MIDAVVALAPTPGLTAGACAALNLSRASVYRQRGHLARPQAVPRPRSKPHRALCAAERQTVLDRLHEPRFADQAHAEIYACLLDEGIYHCSIRTMYRILAESQEVLERRKQLRHPVYKKPELLAQAPNREFIQGCSLRGATVIRGLMMDDESAYFTTPRAWPRNQELAAATKYVRAALGLHPQLVKERSHEPPIWREYRISLKSTICRRSRHGR